MKKIILFVAICLCSRIGYSQKAADVLENGIPVKSGEKIFLQFDNGSLKYDILKSIQDPANPPDYTSLEDSIIFLVFKNNVNVYMTPLNPLNYTYGTDTKEITDPINEAASSALGTIIDVLSTTAKKVNNPGPQGAPTTVFDTCLNFSLIESNLKKIQSLLIGDQKDAIVKVFKSLKKMSFSDEATTISELEEIEKAKASIEKHFSDIDDLITSTKKQIEGYNCDKTSGFITKYIFNSILKDLSAITDEQEKRLKNLQTAYDLVKDLQAKATIGGGASGLKWRIKMDEVPSREGKISIYTVTIKENGYKLSDKNEIVAVESKDIVKRVIRIRKFQRWVPEVSVGTAYTFFKYNTYGTTSDSAGIKTTNQYVAPPTENVIRNLNLTTILNFNYYIQNSPVHPLYQIGVGVNSGIPTFITGFGIRSNINGLRRIAISGGIALTWIKELDKLKVGDKISGTSDIDKDLKFQFTSPKPYIGIQYNF